MNAKRTILISICVVWAICPPPNAGADFTFGEPVNVGPAVNSSLSEWGAWISTDALRLYFMRNDTLYSTIRPTRQDPWKTPANLGPLIDDWSPCKSIQDALGLTTADGLEQYGWGTDGFWGPAGYGGIDIWVTTRGTKDDEWGTPMNLGPVVNSPADEASLAISPDGLELYFSGLRTSVAYLRPGGYGQSDLWATKRATRSDPWGQPVNLGSVVNSASQELRPNISADGLVLFFDSTRPGGSGREDLYMTRRATIFDPWEAPVNLGPGFNSTASDQDAHVSADGSTVFFNSDRPGSYGDLDLWQVPIIPIVDFNGDAKLDLVDLVMLIDDWGKNKSVCDIGPMPWGDGKVDIEDLKVFMAYWEKGKSRAHSG
jgi:hypothetical protein